MDKVYKYYVISSYPYEGCNFADFDNESEAREYWNTIIENRKQDQNADYPELFLKAEILERYNL